MPRTVSARGVTAGFYGKVPARGDFVRVGLPRDFTDPWDSWLERVIAGSRGQMGEAWLPAYLESPVWRFMLPAGLCGPHAVLGLMLPSVDKAGRYFPITFAALSDGVAFDEFDTWLDRAEDAGRAALEIDAGPEVLHDMLGSPPMMAGRSAAPSGSLWWTEGSPRVSATRLTLTGLPDAPQYASMLGAQPDDLSPAPDIQSGQDLSWEAPA